MAGRLPTVAVAAPPRGIARAGIRCEEGGHWQQARRCPATRGPRHWGPTWFFTAEGSERA
eukprot:1910847-Pyramimonas_sp.AAC.1